MAGVAVAAEKQDVLPYKNPKLSVEERLKDLISRMTLEEKVGQLRCTLAWNYYEIRGARSGERGRGNAKLEVVPSESFKKDIAEGQIGMLWATYRADPWTQKSLSNGLNPELAAMCGNALQRYVMENTRLGIPLFLAEEAPHGHMAIGATVFPTGLGMAATWSRDIMRQTGAIIGKEVRSQGGHISYGPVLDLAREPRWSRVEETLGEDPFLCGKMGEAMILGLGGGDLSLPYSTIATLKHFIAYGTSEGGQNGARSIVGPRELKQVFLPPFQRVIDAGALSVMTSYNSLDGVPCTSNRELLTGVLRNNWAFNRGIVVSDLFSIDGLRGTHRTAASLQDAAIQALLAGVDVDLGGNCYAQLANAVKEGKVSEEALDQAVGRVLRLKFEMGLFEHPYVDDKTAGKLVNNAEAVATARQAARESITLLKNDGILPLSKNLKVAVIGPNADNVYNMLGDYTAPQPDGKVITVYNGIKAMIGEANCCYAKGCAIRDTLDYDIAAAIEAANKADVVIAVVGGSSARDFKTSYEDTGAASAEQKTISDMECGEGFDRATLDLLGRQNKLLDALKKTGKPLVVVYIEGRPLNKNWADENANALLTAYYPGEQGGNAVADVLFGDYNPAGRLPVSVPRHVGQLPVYYNQPRPVAHDYVEMTAKPLYPFGYGLSYTSFEYSDLSIAGDQISFKITNTGSRKGDEVVQLYVSNTGASVVQPERQLIGFERVTLEAGESRIVTFNILPVDLAIVNDQMQWAVEGEHLLLVGSSSEDIRLKGRLDF